jgi:hypothetical protein
MTITVQRTTDELKNTFGIWTVLYRTRSLKTVRRVNKCMESGGGHFEHYL